MDDHETEKADKFDHFVSIPAPSCVSQCMFCLFSLKKIMSHPHMSPKQTLYGGLGASKN